MKVYLEIAVVLLWVLAVFMRIGGYALLAIFASLAIIWLFKVIGGGRKIPVE